MVQFYSAPVACFLSALDTPGLSAPAGVQLFPEEKVMVIKFLKIVHQPSQTLVPLHMFPGYSKGPRSLAGKPLAGFPTTTGRRITVVYGMIVYAIRFNNPLLHR